MASDAPHHPVLMAANAYRRAVARLERAQSLRLIRAYGRIYESLQDQISILDGQIRAYGDPPTRNQIRRLATLKRLEREIEDEVTRFAAYADEEISQATREAIAMGQMHARQMTFAGMPQRVSAAIGWKRLDPAAVETLMGFLAPGSPLRTALVTELGPAVAAGATAALVEGMALGYNPRKVARIMRNQLGVGLTSALRTARTATLWASRESTRAGYVANSHIVKGWIWHSALDHRTCMSCIVMHGTFHTLDETLNDHHNGRCAMVPVTPTWEELGLEGIPDTNPEIEMGEAWFVRLSDAQQQVQMGNRALWRAWKDGEVAWEDLSHVHDDDAYGPMRVQSSLRNLLGSRAFEYYGWWKEAA